MLKLCNKCSKCLHQQQLFLIVVLSKKKWKKRYPMISISFFSLHFGSCSFHLCGIRRHDFWDFVGKLNMTHLEWLIHRICVAAFVTLISLKLSQKCCHVPFILSKPSIVTDNGTWVILIWKPILINYDKGQPAFLKLPENFFNLFFLHGCLIRMHFNVRCSCLLLSTSCILTVFFYCFSFSLFLSLFLSFHSLHAESFTSNLFWFIFINGNFTIVCSPGENPLPLILADHNTLVILTCEKKQQQQESKENSKWCHPRNSEIKSGCNRGHRWTDCTSSTGVSRGKWQVGAVTNPTAEVWCSAQPPPHNRPLTPSLAACLPSVFAETTGWWWWGRRCWAWTDWGWKRGGSEGERKAREAPVLHWLRLPGEQGGRSLFRASSLWVTFSLVWQCFVDVLKDLG